MLASVSVLGTVERALLHVLHYVVRAWKMVSGTRVRPKVVCTRECKWMKVWLGTAPFVEVLGVSGLRTFCESLGFVSEPKGFFDFSRLQHCFFF